MNSIFFSSVFCLLLITTCIFVAIPATAIVEIEVSGEFTITEQNEIQIAIQLTYNVVPDPKPTVNDLTLNPSTSVTFSEGDDSDSKTYFITWSELNGPQPVSFFLKGYMAVTAQAVQTAPDVVGFNFTPSLSVNNKLIPDSTYLPGLGYVIVAANNTAIASGVYPTLPTINPPNAIIKVQWSDVSSVTQMPDLFQLFQDGGTLNLRVNEPGTTNRLGSRKDDGSYDNNRERNQRQVVINEVMWAHDESFVGNAAMVVREQWIELYNRGTTPIQFSDIELTTSKQDPGPPAETDRLSNIPSYSLTWEIGDKGQHGSSQTPRKEFKSMQRDNYNNGWEPGHWSIATITYLRNYRGTPGKQNRAATVRAPRQIPGMDEPAKNKIIINEIGNLSINEDDWIELRNVTGSDQSLKEWTLTKTIGYGNEEEIIRFPDISMPARSVLLLTNKNPSETSLSLGFDVTIDAEDQDFGAGPNRYLIVDENKLAIPNDDQWLLILRNNKPWDVGSGRDVYQTGHKVQDVAGPAALHEDFVVMDLDSASPRFEKKSDGKPEGEIWHTKVFPLNGNLQNSSNFLQSDRLNSAGKVWVRDSSIHGYLKDSWKKIGFTGIGYDRSVSASDEYGGTPGYDNNIVRGKVTQLDGGKLMISELMLTSGSRASPQWIELYNTSKTRGIDLAADSSDPETGWQIIIENHDSGSWKEDRRPLNITVNLKDLFPYGIGPNQSVLIVSSKGRASNRDYYPDSRVAGIFETKKSEFGMTSRRDHFLNAEGGFYIQIVDGDGVISDEVGNLDGLAVDLRQGIEFDDPFSWNWPTDLTEDGFRTSLIRLRDQVGRPRVAVPNRSVEGSLRGAVLPMGMNTRPAGYAWVHAVDTAFERVRYRDIWYGSDTDISTPGFIRGTPLPVSLSFFRPSLENGEVVIRWTTESEVDNAGFNILRSTNRSGEFTQVNSALIQGAGTSSERNTYKWVDTTAKQGVIYYYQIEDVSYAGERQLLTTTRLKGMISPRSKLTTTWSQLKTLR